MARVCSKRVIVLSAAVLAAVSGMAGGGGARADEVRIVAKFGDLIPGGDGQSVRINRFSGFTNASIPLVSDSGHVLFTAEIAGTGVTTSTNRGLWRGNPTGTFSPVARVGTGVWAPSTSLSFGTLSSPMINDAGMCAFLSTLVGTGVTTSNSRSYWCANGGAPQLLVRESESASMLGSGIGLGTISEPEWRSGSTGGGLLIFKSTLLGTGITTTNNRALWADSIGANNSVPLARAGYAIDEFPTLTCKEPYRATNDIGQAVLYATLTGSGIITLPGTGEPTVPNDQVIWAPNATQAMARAGVQAPGAPTGTLYSSLFAASTISRRPQLNDRGHTAFAPTLCNTSGVAIGSGIWSNRTGQVRPVVMSGDTASGLPAGATIGTPIAPVTGLGYVLCGDDSVVFVSVLQGGGVSFSTDRVIFRSRPGAALELLVRGGQQAPGAPAGVVITNDSIARCWRVNAQGDIAFVASLAGPGVTDTNDAAVFSTTGGTLRLVAREGDVVPQSGDWRISGMLTEPLMYLNARGQVLFPASITGGPTGYGVSSAWLRIDEAGSLRALAIANEIVPGQTGARVRMNSISTFAPVSFSDAGDVVMMSSLMPGGDFTGEAVISFRIQPAQTEPTGACCTGTACTAVLQSACTGSFAGVGAVCDPPGNPVLCCPANFNRAGGLELQDLFDFLAAFFAASPSADYNRSGVISTGDIYSYLADYLAGCGG